jgi:hypothetical protein
VPEAGKLREAEPAPNAVERNSRVQDVEAAPCEADSSEENVDEREREPRLVAA